MVQQAESTDGTATVEHQNVPRQEVGAPDGASESAPDVDLSAKVQELEKALADSENRAKTFEGRNSIPIETLVTKADLEVYELANKKRFIQASGGLDDDEKTKQLSELTTEEQKAQGIAQAKRTSGDIASWLGDTLTDLGFTKEDSVWKTAEERWNEAPTDDITEMTRVWNQVEKFIIKEHMTASKKQLDDVQKKANQANGTLELGSGSGGGGGSTSPKTTWAAYGRGEIPWSKSVQEAGKAEGAL